MAMRIMDVDDVTLRQLFALNVLLQIVDGILTHRAMELGFPEGNPVIRASMATLGSGAALLLFKANACGLLLLLARRCPPHRVRAVLGGIAVAVVLLAVAPWLGKYLSFALFTLRG
jgi:hypothetical protein